MREKEKDRIWRKVRMCVSPKRQAEEKGVAVQAKEKGNLELLY